MVRTIFTLPNPTTTGIFVSGQHMVRPSATFPLSANGDSSKDTGLHLLWSTVMIDIGNSRCDWSVAVIYKFNQGSSGIIRRVTLGSLWAWQPTLLLEWLPSRSAGRPFTLLCLAALQFVNLHSGYHRNEV
jgi:hypothetical protein